MSALSHMDAFSVIYMVFVCVAVFNDERVVSTRIWNVLNFFLIVAIIIRYLAEIKFPMDSHLRRSWSEYLSELDSSVLPGLSFWLSLDQSSTSDKSWAFDFVTLVASISYSSAVKNFEAKRAKKLTSMSEFIPPISSLDDFTIQSMGIWDNIQLTDNGKHKLCCYIRAVNIQRFSINIWVFFFALSYITCASSLILSRNSIKQTLTLQRIRRFNILVLFAIVIYQIPYIRISLDSIQYDKIHGRTPSAPYQCASSDLSCIFATLFDLRKYAPVGYRNSTEIFCGSAFNGTRSIPLHNCTSAFDAPFLMSSHLAVFVILAIAYHFQYHPSFKMYSIPNFSRMSRENATLVRQAMNNEKKIIAISWLKKIRSQHVMEQRLRAVIKKVEVWQHEVRNGGVAAGNKSKEILPATPYNLKVREIPAEGGNSTTVKFTLVWESDNLNSNDNNNAEIESSPIFYKIALQKLPSHTLLGSFEVVATVENKNQVVLESLEPATTYEVKVCAYNDVGESLWSKLYKFKTSSMFTNASREVVSMDGDVGNNDSTSTGNVKDDETKSTSPAEQLQDESMSNLEDDDESACCTNTWQYFVSHTEYLSTFCFVGGCFKPFNIFDGLPCNYFLLWYA